MELYYKSECKRLTAINKMIEKSHIKIERHVTEMTANPMLPSECYARAITILSIIENSK